MIDIAQRPHRPGFTLLEVIVSLVVASILGAMLVSFLGTGVVRSGDPLLQARNGAYLNQIMENMTADYKKLMAEDSTPIATFISRIGSEGSSATTPYADVSHAYTVVDNHRISFPSSGTPVTESADNSGKVLKVTIRYQGLTLTSLFSE